ncbi:MAG: hypothetical protein IT360_10415 [Gemmatimonadaceae bacterium]|nr:hypothetical protein [Gemmatimonadaceae bacterium]
MNPTPQLVLLVAVAVVVGGVALLPRREIGHPLVVLLRVLLPSWRFFDDIEQTTALIVRVARAGEPFGPWRAVLPVPTRGPLHLVWNPAGNLLLAQHALLERLLSDVAEWDEGRTPGLETLVSYQLVLNLVRSEIVAGVWPGADGRIQFKLVDATAPAAAADLLISREHAAC